MLPPTRQRWHSSLYPSWSWYSVAVTHIATDTTKWKVGDDSLHANSKSWALSEINLKKCRFRRETWTHFQHRVATNTTETSRRFLCRRWNPYISRIRSFYCNTDQSNYTLYLSVICGQRISLQLQRDVARLRILLMKAWQVENWIQCSSRCVFRCYWYIHMQPNEFPALQKSFCDLNMPVSMILSIIMNTEGLHHKYA